MLEKKRESLKYIVWFVCCIVLAVCPVSVVTVSASAFADVKYEDWFYTCVKDISDKGIMQGYQNGSFGSYDFVTREQFAAIIYRMAGSPKIRKEETLFEDIPSDAWYKDAVIWSNEQGIVSGYDKAVFGAGDTITREQLVTMLYRYAAYKGEKVAASFDCSVYPDANRISKYAKKSLRWALKNEILTGRSYEDVVLLEPQGKTTRAECAALVQRFLVRCLGEFNGHIVAIDPGHQRKGNYEKEPIGPGSSELKAKVTSGTQGKYTKVEEYVVNLDVSLLLKEELLNRGYQVIMIRETHDVNISNAERAAIANNSEAEILLRIHCNGVENSSVRGALTMAPTASNKYVGFMSSECKKLSQLVIDHYCAVTGFKNRGIQYADNMSGINWCKVPVTIVEMGFMSNKEDDYMLVDKNLQKKMARGIADGVDAYFGR